MRHAGPLPVLLGEVRRESGVWPIPAAFRPGRMGGARAVAGLAGDVDVAPCRGETVGLGIVVLAVARGMAVRAHVVPILVDAGPVDRFAGPRRVVPVHVKPALPACLRRAGIPGDPVGLQAAVRHFEQILLQRIGAEGVRHLVRGHRPIGASDLQPPAAVAPEETRALAGCLEGRAGKIPEHAVLGRFRHRQVMMGSAPQVRFLLVATAAS